MKNKNLKNKILATMLIGSMALSALTLGCGKKTTPTKGDVTSVEETSPSEEETKPSEEETTPSEASTTSPEVETEIETKEDGSVTVNTTTYETDAEGEVVTTTEGEKVIAETKTETFTKEEWESKTAATKPVETKPSQTKPVEATTAAPQATKAPVVKPTEAPKPAQTEASKQTEAPTPAPTQAPKPTVAPTQAPTEAPKPTVAPTAAPTEAPKPTEAPTADPKAGWQTVTLEMSEETLTLYSNGEWIFDLIEDTSNPEEYFGSEWYSGHGLTSGIAIYKYIGNNEVVNIPGYIDGFPVKILIFPFKNNTTVKEVTVAKEIEYFFQAFNHASVAKITIETGSKAIGVDSWGASCNFNTKTHDAKVYCDKAVAEAIKGWNLEPVICYSFDGNTVYYNSHTDRTSH